jgi:hypothetical protein
MPINEEVRVCPECGEELPLTRVYWHVGKNGHGGFRYPCKKCRNELLCKTRVYDSIKRKYYYEKYKYKDHERYKKQSTPETRRHSNLRKNYKISLEDYNSIFEQQKGVCAICESAETALDRNGNLRPLSVDHDHDTGKVRSLLCARCNSAIGLFKENYETILKAAEYVKGMEKCQ